MKKIILVLATFTIVLQLASFGVMNVKADDDDDFKVNGMMYTKDDYKKIKKEYKKFKNEHEDDQKGYFEVDGVMYNRDDYETIKYAYKKFKHREDDDEDDEDDEDGYDRDTETIEGATQEHFWNVWSRQLHRQKGNLPFTQPAKITFIQDQEEKGEFYVIPSEGELFVPSQEVVRFLGGKAKFYDQSKIVVLEKEEKELIVKSGTNVAYESRIKTPMPAKAMYYQNSVYIPISVLANAFNYIVDWDEEKSLIKFEK